MDGGNYSSLMVVIDNFLFPAMYINFSRWFDK